MIRLFILKNAVDSKKPFDFTVDPNKRVTPLGGILLEQDGTVYAQYFEVAATGDATVTLTYTKAGEQNPVQPAPTILLSVTKPAVVPPTPPVGPVILPVPPPAPVPPARSKTTRMIEVNHDSFGNLTLFDAKTRKAIAFDAVKVNDVLYFNAGDVQKNTADLIGPAVQMRSKQDENGWYMYWADVIAKGLGSIHVTRPAVAATPAGGAASPGVPAATYDATIKVQ